MEPTTLDLVTARKKKKSIDTLGGQRKFLLKGFWFYSNGAHPNLLIFFEACYSAFRFPVNKYIQ